MRKQETKKKRKKINESSNYEGSTIMQAILSHSLSWKVIGKKDNKEGSIQFDPSSVSTRMHQVDVYPDLSYDSGNAKSSYIIHDLAAQNEILKKIDNWLCSFVSANIAKEEIEPGSLDYTTSIQTSGVIFRGLSSDDPQNPKISFKASTDFVSKFEGEEINNWDKVRVIFKGEFGTLEISTKSQTKLEDIIDSNGVMLIEQILPSLILSFHADKTVDSKSNK